MSRDGVRVEKKRVDRSASREKESRQECELRIKYI